MLTGWVVIFVSFAYLGILFAIAWVADRRADQGRSLIANPTVYALSLAVYCTTWTFYGSVGRAAATGIGFLPIYLGPTLMMALGWFVIHKIIRVVKANRITSIADFIASRYGKSQLLGGLVTVIAVVGVIPYIALQLKAVSSSFKILASGPDMVMLASAGAVPLLQDSTLYVAIIMAAFTILFGTRHLDATERHEGMVAAIAFESVVKLVAFIAVGLFVTYGMFDGIGDIFARVRALQKLEHLLTTADTASGYGSWAALTFLSFLSVLLLPRQFQIAVVENVNESHLRRAAWLFPLYLFLITVADAQGLSWYGDTQVARRLSIDEACLRRARGDLIRAGLLAYAHGLYQVLALDMPPPIPRPEVTSSEPSSVPALPATNRIAVREHLAALHAALGRSP